MGWGQPHQPRQGDMGAGVLTTSQAITQRSIERSAGRALADAVRRWLADGTTGNREQVADALTAFDEATKTH